MRKSTLAVLAACAAMLAGLALPALASAFSSSVTITFVDRPGPDIFRGRVMSVNNNCISDRPVRLFQVRPGADRRIDSDESEDDGRWDIDVEGDPAPGDYYARVIKTPLGANNCGAASSPTIPVAG